MIDICITCTKCDLPTTTVQVRERFDNESEDGWVNNVVDKFATNYHAILSPLCSEVVPTGVSVSLFSKRGVGYLKKDDETENDVDNYWAKEMRAGHLTHDYKLRVKK